jgi:tetratricopeptide (TPR) repeat protein
VIIAHREGRLPAAVRWGGRGLRVLDGVRGSAAKATRARLLAELAFIRWRQGRFSEGERFCRTAIEQSKGISERRPLAHASYVLDLVLVDLGRPDEAVHSPRALAIYERLGAREEQGTVLNNMAMLAYFRWEWGEALRLYGRAAECCERAGDPGQVATIECNIGEILSDRGQYEQAEKHLTRAHRVWSATGDRGAAAFAATLLGRMAARAGDFDQAHALVSEAAAVLRARGETRYLEFVEAVLAEAEAFGGEAQRALTIASKLLSSESRELPLLHRVRGVALARLGRQGDAIRELELSLSIARSRTALYDTAATLDILHALSDDYERACAERDAILAQLEIERLPVVSLASAGDRAETAIAG